jgi:hypothetical protein
VSTLKLGQRPPWPSSEAERLALENDAQALVGARLARASYLAPASSELGTPSRAAAIDVTRVGLELLCDDGRCFSAIWAMDGFNEGLSIGPGPGESRHSLYELTSVDVTDLPRWARLLHRPITGVDLGWHVPNEGCPRTIWAACLRFEGRDQLTIALGCLWRGVTLEYQPDEVVVIFDPSLASAYRPAGAEPTR